MSLSLEEQNELLEHLINNFPGYQDPFWYEKKKSKHDELYWKVVEMDARIMLGIEKKRPNTKSAGTRPDKEVRWKNYPKCAGTNHMVEFIGEWK